MTTNNLPFIIVYSGSYDEKVLAYEFASDLRGHGLPAQALTVDQIGSKTEGFLFLFATADHRYEELCKRVESLELPSSALSGEKRASFRALSLPTEAEAEVAQLGADVYVVASQFDEALLVSIPIVAISGRLQSRRTALQTGSTSCLSQGAWATRLPLSHLIRTASSR